MTTTTGLFSHKTPGGGIGVHKRQLSRLGEAWTPKQDALFCDALADGASISQAARAAGKTKGSGISRLRKICRQLGAQAV